MTALLTATTALFAVLVAHEEPSAGIEGAPGEGDSLLGLFKRYYLLDFNRQYDFSLVAHRSGDLQARARKGMRGARLASDASSWRKAWRVREVFPSGEGAPSGSDGSPREVMVGKAVMYGGGVAKGYLVYFLRDTWNVTDQRTLHRKVAAARGSEGAEQLGEAALLGGCRRGIGSANHLCRGLVAIAHWKASAVLFFSGGP